MIKDLIDKLHGTPSKSTDKLVILAQLTEQWMALPLEGRPKLKSLHLRWDDVNDVIVPVVVLEFYN